MLNSLSLVIIQSLIFACVAYDYCSDNDEVKNLCLKEKHTICTLDKEFAKGSKLLGMVPITRNLRRIMLREHNNLREKTAAGLLKSNTDSFPKAVRMREYQWDRELAYIASKHAAKCLLGHDKCRNTKRFMFSGQNLAWEGDFERIKTDVVIVRAVYGFEAECFKVKAGKIDVDAGWTPEVWTGIGHLTVIINEQNSRVGCALAFCGPDPEMPDIPYNYLMTCNYDYSNVDNVRVYKSTTNATASDCEYWGKGWKKSANFDNLCAAVEEQ